MGKGIYDSYYRIYENAAEGQGHTIVIPDNSGAWTEGSTTYDPATIPDTDRISVTRHVARVQLEGLDCNFTQNYCGCYIYI